MKPNRIAVLTSGGDVPGLNAALHAIVLTAAKKDIEVIGIHDGYEGLIDSRFTKLEFNEVRNIMDEGGTILHTSRSERFKKKKYRKVAHQNLIRSEIDGLIVVGGNGSLKGASIFTTETGFPVMGIPKTIDNDVYGTDYAVGFDTAINTIVGAVDRIKDTADSTSRLFVVEVMGRKAGFLALHAGLATSADSIIIPEVKPDLNKLKQAIGHNLRIGNKAMIILVTENTIKGGSGKLKEMIDREFPGCDCRLTVLGHIQRGGSPTAFDRLLATQLAYQATTAMAKGKTNVMVGLTNGKITFAALKAVASGTHQISKSELQTAEELSILI